MKQDRKGHSEFQEVASPTQGSGPEQWSAVLMRDEISQELSHEFRIADAHGGITKVEVPNTLNANEAGKLIRKYTTMLPRDHVVASSTIDRLRAAANLRDPIDKASIPGWKPIDSTEPPTGFATAHRIIPRTAAYRWSAQGSSRLGEARGSLVSWQKNVAALAEDSTYLTFAIMLAAAPPLLRFADLPETAVFNLVGKTSVGKSTVAAGAMSVFGPPAAMKAWDLKNRALEEEAAAHNDCLLVLDRAEGIPPSERARLLERIIHMLPEGSGTIRSSVVQDGLPNKVWRTLCLSTSNLTGPEMLAPLRAWADQDSARFLDIPVSDVEAGGVFDLMAAGKSSSDHVKALKVAVQENHGTFLRPWINYLLSIDTKSEAKRYSDEYLEKDRPSEGLDERIATKFALVYAAGRLAIEAGLLPWQREHAFKAVAKMHLDWYEARPKPSQTLQDTLVTIAQHLDDGSVKDLEDTRQIVVSSQDEFMGVKTIHNGHAALGLRTDFLNIKFGPDMAKAVLSWMRQRQVLMGGQGSKAASQLAVHLTIGDKVIMKPRFLMVYEEPLRQELSKLVD